MLFLCQDLNQLKINILYKLVTISPSVKSISPCIRTDNVYSHMVNWLTIMQYRRYRWKRFWRAILASHKLLTTSFANELHRFTDSAFIPLSLRTDNIYKYLPIVNCLTISTCSKTWSGYWKAVLCPHINVNSLIHQGLHKFIDGAFISPMVRTDNIYLPMVNWLTIDTEGTDRQGIEGLSYDLQKMQTNWFTKGLYKFTNGVFISSLVRTNNIYLPMVNWLTIDTEGTDGQGFRGLPYALILILTTSVTHWLYKFTDGAIISPSVR